MEAIEYIKKFKMDQPNFEFKREDFVKAFGEDFKACLNNPQICGIDPATGKLPYPKFKQAVKNFESKFQAISRIKLGKQLSKGLWNAFYAIWVIPTRASLYPDLNKKIIEQVSKRAQNNKQCPRRQYKRS